MHKTDIIWTYKTPKESDPSVWSDKYPKLEEGELTVISEDDLPQILPKVPQILWNAASILDQGWTQMATAVDWNGKTVMFNNPSAAAWSVTGAIMHSIHIMDLEKEDLEKALSTVSEYIIHRNDLYELWAVSYTHLTLPTILRV